MVVALGCLMLFTVPAIADMGTMPAYPGSLHPLPAWETPSFGIASTGDSPELVVRFYLKRLQGQGWYIESETIKEALSDARRHEPAWLTFKRSASGRLDIQVTSGRAPRTPRNRTLIFCQSKFRL
jgi:hypothetical protein